jgi:hypothetical protein
MHKEEIPQRLIKLGVAMIDKVCVVCGKPYRCGNWEQATSKYCSRACFYVIHNSKYFKYPRCHINCNAKGSLKYICPALGKMYKMGKANISADKLKIRNERISKSNTGKVLSEETKRKLSLINLGKVPPNIKDGSLAEINRQRLYKPLTEIQKDQLRKANTGKHHTAEQNLKVSIALKGKPKNLTVEQRLRLSTRMRGNKTVFYIDGRSKLIKTIRNSCLYKLWRRMVYERDNYICQACEQRGGSLHPHHKIPFILLLRQYNITSVEQAFNCEPIWDVNNGLTLCHDCHKKTDTYGGASLYRRKNEITS